MLNMWIKIEISRRVVLEDYVIINKKLWENLIASESFRNATLHYIPSKISNFCSLVRRHKTSVQCA